MDEVTASVIYASSLLIFFAMGLIGRLGLAAIAFVGMLIGAILLGLEGLWPFFVLAFVQGTYYIAVLAIAVYTAYNDAKE